MGEGVFISKRREPLGSKTEIPTAKKLLQPRFEFVFKKLKLGLCRESRFLLKSRKIFFFLKNLHNTAI